MQEKAFYGYKDLENYFSIGEQTIRKMIREGSFPPGMKVGKKVLWPKEVVELFGEKMKDRYMAEKCK